MLKIDQVGREWPAADLMRLPGRAGKRVHAKIVLERRDRAGHLVGLHVLRAGLRQRAAASCALRQARELYPAARLQLYKP